MSKTIVSAVAGVLLLAASLPAQAQQAPAPAAVPGALPAATTEALTDADIARMRAELRADKKKVTAETLQLTDAKAAKFWPIYDKYIAELRADKKKVTAETLQLTDAEAAKFWPIYDKYIAELTVINTQKYDLIKEYTEKFGTYTDAQATDFIKRWLDVDVQASKLRSKYVPIVGKVLPGVKTATFFQIDRRLAMLINLGLAAELPILQLQSQVTPK